MKLDKNPQTVNVLFHINRDDIGAFQQVLNQVESLLAEYQNNPEKLHIEIVANGTGLNLYRADKAEFAARIHRFRELYENVVFIGCENTYQLIQTTRHTVQKH